jgi:O-antigen ligase/glycosyltransferase involved in cell wall biosynthesis
MRVPPFSLRTEAVKIDPRYTSRALQPYKLPPPLDVALLLAAVALWFGGPGLLTVLGLPLVGLYFWRRRSLGDAIGTGLDGPVFLLAAWGVLALIPSRDLAVSFTRLLGLWLGVALFLVFFDVLTSEKRLWVVMSALAALGLLVTVLGPLLVDWSLDGGFQSSVPALVARLTQTSSLGQWLQLHPNKLAATIAILLPLPAAVMLFTPGRLIRLYWGLGMVLMLAMLALIGSRSGLLAAGVALLALATYRARGLELVLPVTALAAGLAAWLIGPGHLVEDLLSLSLAPGLPATLADRLDVWSASVSLIREHPILGIGIGTFRETLERVSPIVPDGAAVDVPHSHNLYLQYALDLGLPGLVLFFWLLGRAFDLAHYAILHGPTARASALIVGVACGLLAYLSYGLTDAIGPGEKPGLFFWLLLALTAAGARLARSGPRAIVPAQQTAPGEPAIGSVIYVSTFEWSYHTARPQQLARALAEKVPVLYVETTGLRGVGARDLPRLLRRVRRGIAGRHVGLPTLWVFSPLVLPFHRSALARRLNRILLRDAVHGQARDLGLKNPLLLISIPTAASIDLLGHLDEAAAIYDCMDDLTVIPLVDRSVDASEAELAQRVDVMVAASEELKRLKAHLRDDIVVVGQGVEVRHFREPAPCPDDLAAIPGPRLVFVGGIDDRVDFELVSELASLRPGWSIVLIGPQLYVDAAERLGNHPNIHLMGPRSYGDLPGYLQHADVCLIPYRDTAWARACNPVKTLEYLAAGRGVVATDLPAVEQYRPLVRIATTAAGFVEAIEATLAEESPAQVALRRETANGVSWEDRADLIFDLATTVAKRRREQATDAPTSPRT